MFEQMEIGEILRDLRSIKVTPKTREYINNARNYFESNGAIPVSTQMKLRSICKRYRSQMKELHESRERARRTNGLKKLGMTRSEADRIARERKKERENLRQDVGF